MGKTQKIREILKLFPDIKPKEASEKLEITYNKSFCNIFYRVKKESPQIPTTTKKSKTKSTQKPSISDPPRDEMRFVDDPNELLMSCSMRELNKPDPDVQWGRILLTLLEKTGRLETKTAKEVMVRRKLVKYSSNQLIELRKKLIKS